LKPTLLEEILPQTDWQAYYRNGRALELLVSRYLRSDGQLADPISAADYGASHTVTLNLVISEPRFIKVNGV